MYVTLNLLSNQGAKVTVRIMGRAALHACVFVCVCVYMFVCLYVCLNVCKQKQFN